MLIAVPLAGAIVILPVFAVTISSKVRVISLLTATPVAPSAGEVGLVAASSGGSQAFTVVPHTGLLPPANAPKAENCVGVLLICDTHHPVRF